MRYETMNWEAEAARIERCFGLSGCEFREWEMFHNDVPTGEKGMSLWQSEQNPVEIGDGLCLSVSCDERSLDYLISAADYAEPTFLMLTWSGAVVQFDKSAVLPTSAITELARLLFHLKRLTPEIEAKLGVTITAHQRLEWTLEVEA